MKHFSICLLVFCYLCLGETREWPRHTICKLKDFEAYYQSCDPLQDIGFSLNPCKNLYEHDVNISLGVTLRHDINSLHYSLIAFYNEHALLTQEFFLCQNDYQAYSFCGKKKGDFIFFQHPLRTDAALKLKILPHFLSCTTKATGQEVMVNLSNAALEALFHSHSIQN